MLFSFVADWNKYVKKVFFSLTLSQVVHPPLGIQISLRRWLTRSNKIIWFGLHYSWSKLHRNRNANICLSLQSWKPYRWFNGHQWAFIYHGKSLWRPCWDDFPCKDCVTLLCGSLISLPVIWVLLLKFIGMNAEGLEMSFSMGEILFWASIQYTVLFLTKKDHCHS